MTAANATNRTPDRRRERRVPVQLPILVRGKDHAGEKFEERTSSVNLCRGGAAFATRFSLALGCQLDIYIPVTPTPEKSDTEFTTQGRVVHVAPAAEGSKAVVGVEFTGPRFHHIFVSEATS